MNRKWVRAVSTSTVLAAAVYLGIVIWAGRAEVLAALKLVSINTISSVLALSLLNYGLRFVRWHYYLHRLGSVIAWVHNLRIYVGGFALTTTPGKAGELARTLWLQPYGVTTHVSIAAFFAERIQDFIAILLLACLGLSAYPGGSWLVLAGVVFVAVALVVLFVPSITHAVLHWPLIVNGKLGKLAQRLESILELTRGCLTLGPLLLGLVLGLAAWVAECVGFAILMHALGYPLPLVTAFSIYAFAMLAGAISFMPGGLGGSEATMILLLRLYGVPLGVAVSGTLLIRFATLWFAVLLGIFALATRVKAPKERVNSLQPSLATDTPD